MQLHLKKQYYSFPKAVGSNQGCGAGAGAKNFCMVEPEI